jgi:hypothetical protein
MMYWMSLDIADEFTGFCVWEDDKPISIGRVIGRTLKATKKLPLRRKTSVSFRTLGGGRGVKGGEVVVEFESERDAWDAVRNHRDIHTIIIEAGFMRWPAAAMSLAEARGRALALLGVYGNSPPILLRIAPSSWRKGLKRILGVVVPLKRAESKAFAIEYAKQLLGVKMTDDEAEAYLIGYWGLNDGRVY